LSFFSALYGLKQNLNPTVWNYMTTSFAEIERPGILKTLGLHRKELRAWAMYDWANSSFATVMMASILPIYYHDVAASNLAEHERTAYWGYTTGFALMIIALASPALGAIADSMGARKKFLKWFVGFGVIGSGCMYFIGQGDWLLASLLFIIGNIGFAGGNIFYDALLPSVAKKDEVDRVSTAGFAMGYVGGGILLAINLAWILKPDFFGIPDKGVAVRLSLFSVAVWWLLFSIPLFKHVREPERIQLTTDLGNVFQVALGRLVGTFKQIRRFKHIMFFLVGFWFYSDGVGTIIKMATIYGREIGIESNHLIGALLLVQFVGIPATFAFGAIANRIGTKPAMIITLLIYTFICILGYFMNTAWHFWALSILVALVQGGCQALSRSLYASIIPASKATEFFSFFSVSLKFAGIFGPILFGIISQLTGGSRLSILFLITFFAIGIVMLLKLDLNEARRFAEEYDGEIRADRQL
jgi:UMF1 family MFS transporter